MHKYNESGEYFSEKDGDTIKNRLVENLTDESTNVRIYTVVALRSFGDESVIPQLVQVEKHDAHKDSGGTYEVRIEATETLKVLRGQ